MMTLAAIGGYAFNSDRGVEFSQFLAQHCVNCDISSQWKMAIFDPPPPNRIETLESIARNRHS